MAATEIPAYYWQAFFISVPEKEHVFCPGRKWRFDYAWIPQKVAVEIEGGAHARTLRCHACGSAVMVPSKSGGMVPFRFGGGHTGQRYESDIEKYNTAVLLGWRVLRYKPQTIDYSFIKKVVG